jgi:hypothetical protein
MPRQTEDMDEKDIEAPFPREPWQRLLADSADAPSETTDARIRAAARRDVAPRGRRWWLPASLAASFVLAVFVVQSQFGTLRVPARTDADDGAGGAIDARIIDREEAREMREPGRSAAAPSAPSVRKAAPATAEPEDYGYEDSELAADSAGTVPRVGGPEHELRAATEVPEEAIARNPEAEPDFVPAAPAASGAPAPTRESVEESPDEAVTSASRVRRDEVAYTKTPEDWYAEIEKLRAAGRMEEAQREFERLKKAFPGWLEEHLQEQAER